MNLLSLDKMVVRQGTFTLSLDLRIQAQRTGLFGHSGAGKTTLLETITGLLKISSGEIVLGEEILSSVSNHIPSHARRIGYVPQDLALFPHLSVKQNLLYSSRGNQPANFETNVEALGLKLLLNRLPAELSGGEKQRVALGRALSSSPRLLLLDEPLSSLDTPLKRSLLTIIRETAEQFQIPFLYVAHDPTELAALCEDVVILNAGKLQAHGTFQELFAPAATPVYERRS